MRTYDIVCCIILFVAESLPPILDQKQAYLIGQRYQMEKQETLKSVISFHSEEIFERNKSLCQARKVSDHVFVCYGYRFCLFR